MRVHILIPLFMMVACTPPSPEMPDLQTDYAKLVNAQAQGLARNTELVRAMADLAAAHQATHGSHGPGRESRAIERILEAIAQDAEFDKRMVLELEMFGGRILEEGLAKPVNER